MRLLLTSLLIASLAFQAQARDQIRIVGSSTVFPFVAAAAERYSEKTGNKAPIVESIGTGAGILEFCKGSGVNFPDAVNASRQIKPSEIQICKQNGIDKVVEIPIGKDGIIIASNINAEPFELTRHDVFMALAREVPVKGKLVANPYTKWNQINESLPDMKIEVYGPSSTSGTRDAFVELVMQPVCVEIKEFQAAYTDSKAREKACHMMREDGLFIEAGENDNLIVQKLDLNTEALGIFGYSYLEQNIDKIVAHTIDGVEPEFENISDGSYPVARSLYVYTKRSHMESIPGLKEFLEELTSEDALSDEGYLSYKGLIPLTPEQRIEVRDTLFADKISMK